MQTFSSKVPCESSVCKFCSRRARPDAYNDASSNSRTDMATQNKYLCIGDSLTENSKMDLVLKLNDF